jgi:aminoglycoside phosphotransferase
MDAEVTRNVTPAFETETGWSDDLQMLLGRGAGQLLAGAAEASGAQLLRWRPQQVNHQPHSTTTVQYRVDVVRSGRNATETFVASTSTSLPPERVATFSDGATSVSLWRWPNDPLLPGLPDALDRHWVAALFGRLGLATDPAGVHLTARAYRPGRRAVVEARGAAGVLYLKVVRPERVEQLHRLHRLMAQALPVPHSLGWTDDGVLVLPAMPGVTLRAALGADDPAPPPRVLLDLLDHLPAELADMTWRGGPLASVHRHGRAIAAALPSAAGKVDALLERLAPTDPRAIEVATDGLAVPVHGDLYEAQLLVHGRRITGLLDVDTAGAGHRIDDIANCCAHLSVLARMSERSDAVARYGAVLLAEAERRHERFELRRRISAAVVGLATGPFRTCDPAWRTRTDRHLSLAGEWLASAESRRAPVPVVAA